MIADGTIDSLIDAVSAPDINWLFAAAVQSGAALVAIPAAVIGGRFIATRSDTATRVQAANAWNSEAEQLLSERRTADEGAARDFVHAWALRERVIEGFQNNDKDESGARYAAGAMNFLFSVTQQEKDSDRHKAVEECEKLLGKLVKESQELADIFVVHGNELVSLNKLKSNVDGIRTLSVFLESSGSHIRPEFEQYVFLCAYMRAIRAGFPNADELEVVKTFAAEIEDYRKRLLEKKEDSERRNNAEGARLATEAERARARQRLETATAKGLANSDDFRLTVLALAVGALLMMGPGLYGMVAEAEGWQYMLPLPTALSFVLGFGVVIGRIAWLGLPRGMKNMLKDLPPEG